MKLRDVSPSTPHRDSIRYLARVELPLSPAGVNRLQKCVQEYTKDHARVLIAPTQCLGVIHRRGEVTTVLCDRKFVSTSVSLSSQQKMNVSKLQVQPQDVIIFSLLPGGTAFIRSYYRGQVKDWADDLIVEEVEWHAWIALVTASKQSISTEKLQ